MTDVSKNRNTLINSREEARALYAPSPEGFAARIGVEVEMALFRPGKSKPEIPDGTLMGTLQRELRGQGYDAQLEPAGILEYASVPVPVSQAAVLAGRLEADLKVFERVAEAHGFQRSPFSVLPTTTAEDALANMVARERSAPSVAGVSRIYGEKAAHYPFLTTSVQASLSPRDQEEMFRMAYRGYALTPLLIAAMNNGAGFIANNPERQNVHLRAAAQFFGTASGTAESFLKAATAREYVDNHIDAVFRNLMFFGYDLEGGMIMPGDGGRYFTFEDLAKKGLNTQTNYELAESFLYNDIKICNLRDAAGAVVGKRLEVRAADSGYHQPASVLLLTAALVPDGPTASAFDALLKEYGFTGSPAADAALFKSSRAAAVNHQDRFMDVSFGAGAMRDFAQDVAALVVSHFDGQKVGPQLSALTEVLLSGVPDAKVHAERFKTLGDVSAFLQLGRVSDSAPVVTAAPGMKQRA